MCVVARFVLIGWKSMFVGNYTGGGVRRIREEKHHYPSYYFICKSFLIISAEQAKLCNNYKNTVCLLFVFLALQPIVVVF